MAMVGGPIGGGPIGPPGPIGPKPQPPGGGATHSVNVSISMSLSPVFSEFGWSLQREGGVGFVPQPEAGDIWTVQNENANPWA
jgi:hypothetical protein